MILWLLPAFALTALFYASVGFGGGSTYTALLAVSGVDFRVLPIVSLGCNVLVVAGGVWRFSSSDRIPWRKVTPIVALSVPAAWVGGRIPVSEDIFIPLLGISLLAAAFVMVIRPGEREAPASWSDGAFVPLVGAALGLLSGMVGIGGGIFLAPVLHLLGWGPARMIAGTAALFILVNSVAGLTGQLSKPGAMEVFREALSFWPLLLAVIIGGQIGSRLGAQILPEVALRGMTALLITIVALRLLVG